MSDASTMGAVGSVVVLLGNGPLAIGLVFGKIKFAVCVLGTMGVSWERIG